MKGKICILIAMMMYPLMGISQQFYSNYQLLIKDAISGSLVIVEQSYQLQDTATQQLFGRNNKPEFGKSIAIGVKCSNGLIVGNKSQQPWMYDANCEPYLNKYRGILSDMYIKDISDVVSAQKQKCTSVTRKDLMPSINYIWTDSTMLCNTFSTEILDSLNSDSWLVWVCSPKKIEEADSTTAVNYQIFKSNISYHKDSVKYKVAKPQTNNQVWGGIYIKSVIVSPGHIELKLIGCLYDIEDNWYIVPACKVAETPDSANTGEITALEEAAVSEDTLSPVEEDDASKKTRKKKSKKTSNEED